MIFFKNRRLYIAYSGVFFMFFILSARLIYLQIISSDHLINESNKRVLRIKSVSESRGMITDRMGRVLAVNVPTTSIWVDPKVVHKCSEMNFDIVKWSALSSILGLSLKKLLCFINQHNLDRFLYLARRIDSAIAEHISQLKLPGVYIQQESKRYYPAGSAAAHLVGVTNVDNQGIEGVEKSFNGWLAGSPKTRLVYQDRLGRVVEDINLLNEGQLSKSIELSIDERLQYVAYHELNNAVNIHKAKSGSVVLIDINTGEILAIANSPSYNPNNFSSIKQSMMRNRAITDVFEPGSTVKPIVIMTALQHDIIKKDSIINTLPYMINGHRIKDVSFNNQLTISEILKKSSNVGVSKLALAMPVSILLNSYLNFGMGQSTNVGLIGENKGKLYSSNRYDSDIERAALSYGYGLMITPLQLARMYAIIGGLSLSRQISIIKLDKSKSIPLISPSSNQIFSKSLMRTVINMMEVTTTSHSGCHQAAIEGYRVAVKTGTIKKVGSQGKYINKYIACTAGIAPVSNPRFALVVVIDDPKNGFYYGGMVSAPVFKSIMSSTLKIMNVDPDCFNNI
ncbi:peptidoglycan synthase [Candidatus Blochmanniella vafra str. BVAF]|uniref:Peptidoglycan D,D-transpeptidase FtsI n=1 Tax=Blochmanniella vafra (strain BVAF) TaxID=859654 RepID=E8Q5P7_BLOVB|nr:peptidoglycan glycosyltransferase FtsI [Candidatus Blochmannia vafer]ADV33544.1 peptidoglycan synthase [Candidatus Blochmannia vafer str. BVAF]